MNKTVFSVRAHNLKKKTIRTGDMRKILLIGQMIMIVMWSTNGWCIFLGFRILLWRCNADIDKNELLQEINLNGRIYSTVNWAPLMYADVIEKIW